MWFSRCREYYADRFAGRVTGNPSALASALSEDRLRAGRARDNLRPRMPNRKGREKRRTRKRRKFSPFTLDAIGAMGIFDRKSALAMVASSASAGFDASASSAGVATTAPAVSKENLKSAMQWDLWNPWATFYELNSTHPLIAHRLEYLSDQAAAMGDEPYIVFDRRKPESYWDDFALDLGVMFLPVASSGTRPGPGALAGRSRGVWHPSPPLPSSARTPSWAARRLAHLGVGDRYVCQNAPRLPRRLFRPLVGRGTLAQGEGLERAAGAGSTAWDDHRPWRSGADLVRRLRDARRDRDPVPRLPASRSGSGSGFPVYSEPESSRARPSKSSAGSAAHRCLTSSSSRSPSTASPATATRATPATSGRFCSPWSVQV